MYLFHFISFNFYRVILLNHLYILGSDLITAFFDPFLQKPAMCIQNIFELFGFCKVFHFARIVFQVDKLLGAFAGIVDAIFEAIRP